jgi:hypothetical protein
MTYPNEPDDVTGGVSDPPSKTSAEARAAQGNGVIDSENAVRDLLVMQLRFKQPGEVELLHAYAINRGHPAFPMYVENEGMFLVTIEKVSTALFDEHRMFPKTVTRDPRVG